MNTVHRRTPLQRSSKESVFRCGSQDRLQSKDRTGIEPGWPACQQEEVASGGGILGRAHPYCKGEEMLDAIRKERCWVWWNYELVQINQRGGDVLEDCGGLWMGMLGVLTLGGKFCSCWWSGPFYGPVSIYILGFTCPCRSKAGSEGSCYSPFFICLE